MKLKVGQEFASGRTGVRVGKKKKKEKALIFESVVLQAFSINSVQFNSVAQSLSSV